MIQLIYNLSVFFLILVLCWKLYRQKYLIVNSICFWFIFFFFCYISFPCLFINEINKDWNFSSRTIEKTRLLVAFYNIVFGCLYGFLSCKCKITYKKNEIAISESYKIIYQIALFIEIIGSIILLYAIFKMYSFRGGKDSSDYQEIREYGISLESGLHLRLILYLLISSSFYLYYKTKTIKFFLPLFLVVTFELLCGARTTAFVVILYFYYLYVLNQKKLQLKIIIPLLFILLISVLFSRSAFLSNGENVIPSLSLVLGEFFQTFVTLPYIIEKDILGNGFSLEKICFDYVFGSYIPGSISVRLFTNYVSSGEELATIIHRGYGLANNFITEALFNFDLYGLLVIPIPFVIYLLFDNYCGKKSDKMIFKIIFIFQSRLFVREGIRLFHAGIYIILVYVFFFYFYSKIKKVFLLKAEKKQV